MILIIDLGIIGVLNTFFVIALVSLPLYFLPTFIARKKLNFRAIFILNLTLGWTVLGWIGALVWALTVERGELEKNNEPTSDAKPTKSSITLEDIKTDLKDNEMIVYIKENNLLDIITKSQYEIDKELRLTNKYIVMDKN